MGVVIVSVAIYIGTNVEYAPYWMLNSEPGNMLQQAEELQSQAGYIKMTSVIGTERTHKDHARI